MPELAHGLSLKFASLAQLQGAEQARANLRVAARMGWRWFRNATAHRRAALLLWSAFQKDDGRFVALTDGQRLVSSWVLEPALTFMGFAIENLLKGIVVADREREVVEADGRLASHIRHHDLVQLAGASAIDLTDETRSFLRMLTCYVRGSSGRYHLPASIHEDRVADLSILTEGPELFFDVVVEDFAVRLFDAHQESPGAPSTTREYVQEEMLRDRP